MAKPEKKSADELRAELRAKVFTGWPDENMPLEPETAFSAERDGVRLSAWDFTSQRDVPLRLYLLEDAARNRRDRSLTVLDQSGGPAGWPHVRALDCGHANCTKNLAGEFVRQTLPSRSGAFGRTEARMLRPA